MSIPRVSGALRGWMKTQTISRVTKSVVNHKPVEAFEDIVVKLMKQPLPPEKVNRKPEEQRSWVWYSIWMKSSVEFKIDDVIVISGKKYKVQSKTNWDEAGYYSYEATEDFD